MSQENMPVATNAGEKLIPPYVPFKTFIAFIERLGSLGVPNRIDRSAVAHMSGSAQVQVLGALRYFQLINDAGTSHENLRRFAKASEEDRKKAMHGLLQLHYPTFFGGSLDFSNATAGELAEIFSKQGASGDTLRKCIGFLLAAAQYAGIETSKHLKGAMRSATRKRGERNGKKKDSKSEAHEEIGERDYKDKTVDEMILEKYPEFNPEWGADVQKAWFEGIKQLRSNLKGES